MEKPRFGPRGIVIKNFYENNSDSVRTPAHVVICFCFVRLLLVDFGNIFLILFTYFKYNYTFIVDILIINNAYLIVSTRYTVTYMFLFYYTSKAYKYQYIYIYIASVLFTTQTMRKNPKCNACNIIPLP